MFPRQALQKRFRILYNKFRRQAGLYLQRPFVHIISAFRQPPQLCEEKADTALYEEFLRLHPLPS